MADGAGDSGPVPAPDEPDRASLGAGFRALVVDDEAGVRDLLRRWLHALGFEVLVAGSATEALSLLSQPPSVALCDIRMPERDGLWLAEQIRRMSPDTALVIASGMQDVGSAVTSLRHGVVDYLMKPFGRDRLREAMQRAVEWHVAALSVRRTVETHGAEADERLRRLCDALVALEVNSDERLEGALGLLTLRTPERLQQARRLKHLVVATARRVGLDHDAAVHAGRAAVLSQVLELGLAQVTPADSPALASNAGLLRRVAFAAPVLVALVPCLTRPAQILTARHDLSDGSSGPQRPRQSAIPLEAKVLAVVDTFERLTRNLHGRPSLDQATALDELDRAAGEVDAPVVAALRAVLVAGTPSPDALA